MVEYSQVILCQGWGHLASSDIVKEQVSVKIEGKRGLFTSTVWRLQELVDLFLPRAVGKSATKIIPAHLLYARTHARAHCEVARTLQSTRVPSSPTPHTRGHVDKNRENTATHARRRTRRHTCESGHPLIRARARSKSKAMVGSAHLPGGVVFEFKE